MIDYPIMSITVRGPAVEDEIGQRIERAAQGLLGKTGDDFTMDQLAERAGVPRATVYRRVGSKVALLRRLARERGVEFGERPDVRARILLAARRVIGRDGLLNMSMEQVAAEAGAGVATVYRHFNDKDRLIRAVVEELSPRPFVRDLAHPTEDVRADLTALAAVLLPSFYEYRDILRLLLTDSRAERAYIERLREGSDRTLDQMADYFGAQIRAGRIRAAGTPRELALAFLGLLFAFAVVGPVHYHTTLDEPGRAAGLIVRLFLEGVGRPPS